MQKLIECYRLSQTQANRERLRIYLWTYPASELMASEEDLAQLRAWRLAR